MEKHIALVALPPYCILSTAKVALCCLDIYLSTSQASCKLSILDKVPILSAIHIFTANINIRFVKGKNAF